MHATGESFAFDVPITQQSQPNLVVNAVIVHDNQLMTAQKSLKVPLVERTLTITATPSKSQYLPGEKGSFDVYAVDSQGKPVQADLSFGEVDEALYSVRPDTSGRHCELLLSQAICLSGAADLVRLFLLRAGRHEEPAAGGAECGLVSIRGWRR